MRNRSTGIFALAILGFYYLFRNRTQVQQFLNRQGINVDTDNLTNTIRSGASRVVDRVRNRVGQHDTGMNTNLEQNDTIRQVG
jgi:hypothetical protein